VRAPDPRVALAAERTLLAWTRTGISLVALGLVLARFLLLVGRTGLTARGMPGLGMGLVAAGGLLTLTAGLRHLRLVRRWRRGQSVQPSPTLSLVAVLLVLAAAAYALVGIGS